MIRRWVAVGAYALACTAALAIFAVWYLDNLTP